MSKKPRASDAIVSYLLDVGGVIEDRNVNAVLQEAIGLKSSQITQAFGRLEREGVIDRVSNGTRTKRVALVSTSEPEPQGGSGSESGLVPLNLGESVQVVGLFLMLDGRVGVHLQRDDGSNVAIYAAEMRA